MSGLNQSLKAQDLSFVERDAHPLQSRLDPLYPGMASNRHISSGRTNRFWHYDFIGIQCFQHAILMHTGAMSEDIAANDCLIGRQGERGYLCHETASFPKALSIYVALNAKTILAHAQDLATTTCGLQYLAHILSQSQRNPFLCI